MELHTYNTKRPGGGGSRATMPTININRTGRIGINVLIQRTLNAKKGDRLLIAKDTDSRNDWYLSFGNSEQEGFSLYHMHNDRPGVGLACEYNEDMAADILGSVKAKTSATFYVGLSNPKEKDGRTWYRILTANPKFIR